MFVITIHSEWALEDAPEVWVCVSAQDAENDLRARVDDLYGEGGEMRDKGYRDVSAAVATAALAHPGYVQLLETEWAWVQMVTRAEG